MVAHDVATKGNLGVVIPPESIVIAANHTHQGPGNFMTAEAYNAYGSFYGGFSRELFDFLVRRITGAIDLAIQDALSHKDDTVLLSVRTASISESIQMSRSPRTFLLNWNSQQLMRTMHPERSLPACRPDVETGEAREDWDLPGCPRLLSADPGMTLLEILRGTTRVGMLVFFAVHPTVLDAAAPFYSSDFTGYAMARLEREEKNAQAAHPVIGFFNEPEGDVVTQRGRRDLIDVARLGDRLVNAVSLCFGPGGEGSSQPADRGRTLLRWP
jgi:hypothetical protein